MSCKKLDVRPEDPTPHKWFISLREDIFDSFISRGSPTVNKIFGEGSLFSPMLFGKFFDPSDAFPLWEFQSDILLSSLRNAGQSTTDWFETDVDYVLKAELPGLRKYNIQVIVEHGKILEISGTWREQRDSDQLDWRSGRWWEFGYVRRLELPENADWQNVDAKVEDDISLEIRIPKKPKDNSHSTKGNDVILKTSQLA